MSNPTITGDSSNVNITNANLIVTNDIHANAFFDSNGTLIGSGGGGGGTTPTLAQVTSAGNTTTNSITTTSNVDAGDSFVSGTVTAGAFLGDGSGLSGFATVATTGVYSDLSGAPSLATVATTGAYSDLSGAPTSILNFSISDGTSGQFLKTDGAGNFSFDTVSGGGGGTSNLDQVVTQGNITSNTITVGGITSTGNVIINGGSLQSNIVSGNTSTSLDVISNTLIVNMDGLSYKTFTCSTSNNISNVTISGDILGSQGMIFLDATGNITINGTTSGLAGSNTNISFDDIEVASGERALIGFMSDGTNRYINAARYPSAGGGAGLSNLETITTNGNVTTQTVQFTNADVGIVATGNIQANYFVGDGSQLTNLPSGGGGGGSPDCVDIYPSSNKNVSTSSPGTTIVFNNERYSSSGSVFSLNTSTGVLTVNKTSIFMINYTVSTGISSSTSNRSVSRGDLYVNGSIETNSAVFMYNRSASSEENTGSQTIIKSLTSGDTLQIKVYRIDGSETIEYLKDGCGMRVIELV